MDNPRQDFLCVLCTDNGRHEENKHGRPAPGGGEGPHPHTVPTGDGHGVLTGRGGSHASPGTRGGRGPPGWAPRLHLTPGLRWLLPAGLPPHWYGAHFGSPHHSHPSFRLRGVSGGPVGSLQHQGLPHSLC